MESGTEENLSSKCKFGIILLKLVITPLDYQISHMDPVQGLAKSRSF